MDKEKIEYLLTLDRPFPDDSYRDSVVELLTPPAWYHPLKRLRFVRTYKKRLALVMAEYAGDLVNALIGGETQNRTTNFKPDPALRPTTTETPRRTTVAPTPTAPRRAD